MKLEIFSSKVRLRIPELSDAPSLYKLRTNPIVNQYLDRDLPKSISDVEVFIESRRSDSNAYYYIVAVLPELNFAGTICLWNINETTKSAEVGFELLPEFHGKGIMSSALEAVINFAFLELGLNTIDAFTDNENIASKRLLKRFGFRENSEKSEAESSNFIAFTLRKAST